MFRTHHLAEDHLFECYLAEQGGDALEPPAAEHLADCDDCGARYADLRRFMDTLRTEADAELDEIFSPDRQRAQQQQIVRRIKHLGHHARVITFPRHASGQRTPSLAPRLAPRWISVAAAAGLFIVIGVGTVFYSHSPVFAVRTVARTSAAAPAATVAPVDAALAPDAPAFADVNEQFLSDLELALERPRTRELIALDELTPHVREAAVRLR
jgi:hypothetical protein